MLTPGNPTVREAYPSDIPMIVNLLKTVAEESDSRYSFNEAHSWEHVASIVCNGVSFVAVMNEEIVGVVMCGYVDLAFVMTKHLETHHLYALPQVRSTIAAALLLDAVEAFAEQHDIVVIFHQMDYHSALNGKANNSRAVERLYRLRGYEGPVDKATVGQEGRRVGVSYRYQAGSKGSSTSQ